METIHPSMLDLLLETHIGLERQRPGSPEAVEQALGFLKPLNQFVASFTLPEQCWTENYFIPREAAINRLLKNIPVMKL